MKKISIAILIVLFIFTFSSCNSNQGIKFDYFYRGFTAVSDSNDTLSQIVGERIFMTEGDWQDFMGKYCPGIPYYVQVDFTKECLVAEIMNGAKPIYAASYDIKKIAVTTDKLDIQGNFDISTGVYALNSDGHINYFFNIVKINKKDLPVDLNDIYIYKKG